jgi:hypothetical protein
MPDGYRIVVIEAAFTKYCIHRLQNTREQQVYLLEGLERLVPRRVAEAIDVPGDAFVAIVNDSFAVEPPRGKYEPRDLHEQAIATAALRECYGLELLSEGEAWANLVRLEPSLGRALVLLVRPPAAAA